MLQHLAFNWFFLFYSVLGLLLLVQGVIWLIRPAPFGAYLRESAQSDKRPSMLLKSARYLFLFSTTSLVFGFWLRSVVDILFSLGLVSLSFTALSILGRWPQIRTLFTGDIDRITGKLRWLGVFALSTALVVMLLIARLYYENVLQT